MSKHKKKQQQGIFKVKIRSAKKLILSHRLVSFMLVLLLIPVFAVAQTKYKDWDNAQLIKGLAHDFPQLVAQIEVASGLELEQKTECSITTEKFNSGVRTCEVIVITTSGEQIETKIKEQIETSQFRIGKTYENNKGINLVYKNKKICGLGIGARGENVVSLSCITAVRVANIQLAKDVFSE